MREATDEDIGIGPYASKDNRRHIARKRAQKAMIGLFRLGLTVGETETVIHKAFIASCEERARRQADYIAEVWE
jgi:hypothetical protein